MGINLCLLVHKPAGQAGQVERNHPCRAEPPVAGGSQSRLHSSRPTQATRRACGNPNMDFLATTSSRRCRQKPQHVASNRGFGSGSRDALMQRLSVKKNSLWWAFPPLPSPFRGESFPSAGRLHSNGSRRSSVESECQGNLSNKAPDLSFFHASPVSGRMPYSGGAERPSPLTPRFALVSCQPSPPDGSRLALAPSCHPCGRIVGVGSAEEPEGQRPAPRMPRRYLRVRLAERYRRLRRFAPPKTLAMPVQNK